MSPFAGPLFAAALLLGIAGVGKVLDPAATRVALRQAGLPADAWSARLLGAVEFLAALGAVVVGGWLHATFVVAFYLGFAWFARRLERRTRGQAPCGCFGNASAPVGTLHVVLNLAVAVVVAGAIAWPADGISTVPSETPWAGVPFLALCALTTWMLYVSLTALPVLLDAVRTKPAAS